MLRRAASSLSELQLALGDVAAAEASSEAAVDHADRSDDDFLRMYNCTALADAKHQAGDVRGCAPRCSRRPRECRRNASPIIPWLYSAPGLSLLRPAAHPRPGRGGARAGAPNPGVGYAAELDLSLAHHRPRPPVPRPGVAGAGGSGRGPSPARPGRRRPARGSRDGLPSTRGALVTRAALFREVKDVRQKSWHDLHEAMRIAERGGDAFAFNATLISATPAWHLPKVTALTTRREHLESAKALVSACGYHRRDGEVEELEKALA